MSVEKESLVGMSKQDLIDILNAVRQPVLTEEQQAEKRQRQEDRKALGETLKQAEANRVQNQVNCTHKRFNGTTAAVYIPNLDRLYCQHCHGWIYNRPTADAKPHEVNPKLFNELYQLAIGQEF